jgi:hypothetical protein
VAEAEDGMRKRDGEAEEKEDEENGEHTLVSRRLLATGLRLTLSLVGEVFTEAVGPTREAVGGRSASGEKRRGRKGGRT